MNCATLPCSILIASSLSGSFHFDRDLSGLCEIDDALGPLAGPKLRIRASDRNREKCGPSEESMGYAVSTCSMNFM
jgi:hypothetical protein